MHARLKARGFVSGWGVRGGEWGGGGGGGWREEDPVGTQGLRGVSNSVD